MEEKEIEEKLRELEKIATKSQKTLNSLVEILDKMRKWVESVELRLGNW